VQWIKLQFSVRLYEQTRSKASHTLYQIYCPWCNSTQVEDFADKKYFQTLLKYRTTISSKYGALAVCCRVHMDQNAKQCFVTGCLQTLLPILYPGFKFSPPMAGKVTCYHGLLRVIKSTISWKMKKHRIDGSMCQKSWKSGTWKTEIEQWIRFFPGFIFVPSSDSCTSFDVILGRGGRKNIVKCRFPQRWWFIQWSVELR
jgi:hypothetical protein